ncbi:hypothetical protein CVS40_3028 [Lucilia cuprina]|nr:hypothetical protein CVS40_3028 [Lucilia cuprina]
MAPQQKGKQGTKGAKQIVKENQGYLKFLSGQGDSDYEILALLTLGAAYQFMAFMSKPNFPKQEL